MPKKKLMTIIDLYNYCLKNKMNRFCFEEANYELCVQMPAKGLFEQNEGDKHTEGLIPFIARAYHDNINLNNSEIKPEVFLENTKSAPFRPILANIVEDEDTGEKDYGSHDFVVEEDEDGNEKYIYYEQPVGVINKDFSFEYDEKQKVNRAVLNGYLYEGYCQDAIDILNRRGSTDCSIELTIRDLSFDTENNVLVLNDYYISGLTLLGSKVKPGMKGSNVKLADFSSEQNGFIDKYEDKKEFNNLVKRLAKVEEKLASFNIDENSKEGGNKMNKLQELLEKYSKKKEDLSFEVEGLSDEELEAKFKEEFEEVPASDDKEISFSKTFGEKKVEFKISHEDIRYALYQLTFQFDEEDNACYMIRAVYDDSFIMEDWYTSTLYGCKYKVEDSEVSLDGERYKMYHEYLTESEKTVLEEMRSNYEIIKNELQQYQKAELNAKKDAIFEDEAYTQYLETEEFKELINKKEDYSLDELKDKAEIAFAKCVKNCGVFKAKTKEKEQSRKYLRSAQYEKEDSPYGTIFNDD